MMANRDSGRVAARMLREMHLIDVAVYRAIARTSTPTLDR
jgi:hypothetical protein